ncbi:hypothetical protein AB0K48_06295 [Nonomuraea sp. NPDC055795]
MEQDQDWPLRMAADIGKRVEHFRKRANDGKGITVQALADRCRDLHLPLDRSVLAKLEKGLRQSVSVAEVLVLAEALNVAPVCLIFPLERGAEAVEVLPGRHVYPWAAAKWLSGEGLPAWASKEEGDRYFERLDFLDLVELPRDHDNWLLEWIKAKGEAAHAQASSDAELLAVAQRLQAASERGLRATRRSMRADGVTALPHLPQELRHLDDDLPPAKEGAEDRIGSLHELLEAKGDLEEEP